MPCALPCAYYTPCHAPYHALPHPTAPAVCLLRSCRTLPQRLPHTCRSCRPRLQLHLSGSPDVAPVETDEAAAIVRRHTCGCCLPPHLQLRLGFISACLLLPFGYPPSFDLAVPLLTPIMASKFVLRLDPEGQAINFDAWLLDVQLHLQSELPAPEHPPALNVESISGEQEAHRMGGRRRGGCGGAGTLGVANAGSAGSGVAAAGGAGTRGAMVTQQQEYKSQQKQQQ
ncbi:unnamed protein product [Closterium sp. NIES-54]